MSANLARSVAAEAVGTALLAATVIGSGVMAERLVDGNLALALLGNTLATGCMLVVLILIFAPISGAHLNPALAAALFGWLLRAPAMSHGGPVAANALGGATPPRP